MGAGLLLPSVVQHECPNGWHLVLERGQRHQHVSVMCCAVHGVACSLVAAVPDGPVVPLHTTPTKPYDSHEYGSCRISGGLVHEETYAIDTLPQYRRLARHTHNAGRCHRLCDSCKPLSIYHHIQYRHHKDDVSVNHVSLAPGIVHEIGQRSRVVIKRKQRLHRQIREVILLLSTLLRADLQHVVWEEGFGPRCGLLMLHRCKSNVHGGDRWVVSGPGPTLALALVERV
jgi:hypothetical protein